MRGRGRACEEVQRIQSRAVDEFLNFSPLDHKLDGRFRVLDSRKKGSGRGGRWRRRGGTMNGRPCVGGRVELGRRAGGVNVGG